MDVPRRLVFGNFEWRHQGRLVRYAHTAVPRGVVQVTVRTLVWNAPSSRVISQGEHVHWLCSYSPWATPAPTSTALHSRVCKTCCCQSGWVPPSQTPRLKKVSQYSTYAHSMLIPPELTPFYDLKAKACHNVQAGSRAHPAFYSISYRDSYPELKRRSVMVTTRLHRQPNEWSYTPAHPERRHGVDKTHLPFSISNKKTPPTAEGFITMRLTAVRVKAYSCYQVCVHTKCYPTFLLRLTSHKMDS